MNEDDRGRIRDPRFSTQYADYRGLRYGLITPTDIDGFIDFGRHLFVIIEGKYRDAKLPRGQELALERLCDATQESGIETVLLVVEHEATRPAEEIDYANTRVREYRHMWEWIKVPYDLKLHQAVDQFLKKKWQPEWGPIPVRSQPQNQQVQTEQCPKQTTFL